MGRFNIYAIVLMLSNLLGFADLQAQSYQIPYDAPVPFNQNPKGANVTTVDRWGYPHTPKLPTYMGGGGMQTLSLICGNGNQFTLVFEDELLNGGAGNNIGFDDPTPYSNTATGFVGTLGEIRRQTACAVFTYISSVIDIGTVQPIIFFPASQIPQANVLGVGTSFYDYPTSAGFWGGHLNQYITTGINPNPAASYNEHAQITIDFDAIQSPTNSSNYIYFNSDWNISSDLTGDIDLFSVILHEATHCLGFASFMSQNGNSGVSNGLYTTYDQYLYHNSNFVLDASGNYIGGAGATTSDAVLYENAGNTLAYPVFSPVVYQNGSSLSHFDEDRYPNIMYVMRTSSSGGDDRVYTQPELEVLCNLGYTLLNNPACGINFPVGNPDTNIGVGGFNVCTNVIGNDTGNGFAMGIDPGSISVLNGSGTVTYFNNNVICFTPNPNFCGIAFIQYRPRDIVNNIMGTFTTLSITVNCTFCPSDPCNYVCNGGFEDAASAAALDNFCQANGSWTQTMDVCPSTNIAGWCGIGTPDLCVRNAIYQFSGYPALGIPINRFFGPLTNFISGVETYNFPTPNNHYIHLFDAYHYLPVGYEGVTRDLVQPIISGATAVDYHFEIHCFSKDAIGSINVYLAENQPPLTGLTPNFTSGFPILINEPIAGDGQWHTLTSNITIPANMPIYTHIVIEATRPNDGINSLTPWCNSLLIDDIRLEKAGDQLQIEKAVSDATPQIGDIITYTLTITNNGTNTSAITNVNDALPANSGLQYVVNPNFPVQIPALAPNASTVITYQVEVTNLAMLNTPITNCATVENSACLSSSDCVDVIVYNTDIALHKVLTTDNPIYGSTVDFSISISNNGPNDAHYVQVLDALYNSPCLSYVSHTLTGATGLYNNGNGILTIPLLPVGQVATWNITALFDGNTLCEANCENCVSLAGLEESDLNTSNDISCAPIPAQTPTIDFVIGSNTTILNATDLINAANTNNLTNMNLQIDGTFVVNEPLIWNNCQVSCNFGSKIEVIVKQFSLINGTHLYACENMWWGIELIDLSQNVTLTCNKAIIEDAQWAVWANHNTTIIIDQTTFRQNFVGIYIPQHQIYNTVGGSVSNSTFDGYTPLQSNTPFAGQSPAPLQRALAGMWIHDVAFWAMDNTFQGLCNGIIANRCHLTVDRCLFRDIQVHSNYAAGYGVEKIVYTPTGTAIANSTQNFNGTGIISWGARGFFSLRQTGFGKGINDPLSFDNCNRGIVSIFCNLLSHRNNMTITDEAYFVDLPSYVSTNIVSSRMNCVNSGINVILSDFSNLLMISDNDISVHNPIMAGNNGISLSNFATATNAYIWGNNIHINKARNGIFVRNADKVNILRNEVYLLSTIPRNGILVENVNKGNVLCNEVGGYDPIHANAIHFYESTNNLISCNTTYQTANGFYFQGNCTTDEQFRGNTIGNHGTGLRIGDGNFSAKIGVQTHRGNKWTGNYGNVGAVCGIALDAPLSPFYVHTGSTPWYPPSLNPMLGWFDANQTNITPFDSCGNVGVADGLCLLIPTDNPHKRTASDYQVANGLDTDFLFGEEMRYNSERDLFSRLLQDSAAIADTGIIRTFYDSKMGTSMNTFSIVNTEHNRLLNDSLANELALIDSLISNKIKEIALQDSLIGILTDSLAIAIAEVVHQTLLNELNNLLQDSRDLATDISDLQNAQATIISTENSSISENLLVEANEKTINEIFYATIARDNLLFTEAQAEQIRDIAFQCPLSGGKGVFKARSLYVFIYGDTTYNDSATCAAQGLSWRKGNPKPTPNTNTLSEFVKIQPNPANEEVSLIYSEIVAINTSITLTNTLGIEVKNWKTAKEGDIFTFSVTDLPQGIYFVHTNIGAKILTNKLVINH